MSHCCMDGKGAHANAERTTAHAAIRRGTGPCRTFVRTAVMAAARSDRDSITQEASVSGGGLVANDGAAKMLHPAIIFSCERSSSI